MPTIINVPSNEEYSSFEKAIVNDETRDHLLELYRSMPELSTYLRKATENHWRNINALILSRRIHTFHNDWSQYKACDISVVERDLPNTILSNLEMYGVGEKVFLPAYYEQGVLIDIVYRSNFMDTEDVHVLEVLSKDNEDKYYGCTVLVVL